MSDPAPFSFGELFGLLRGSQIDVPCPQCSPSRKAINRNKPVLRLWRIDARAISFCCVHCEASGCAWENGKPNRIDPEKLARAKRQRDKFESKNREQKIASARRIWTESGDPRGTWAEEYLRSRGFALPADPEILLRTLRYHPSCFDGPALVAAFTPILTEVPDDPFHDRPPVAIHRIRGRGHDNKKMLGPVKNCAVMISPWWHVSDTLQVCEGVETALALWNEGAADPDACHRPVWALGSAGAIERLPVIERVRRLVIWADHDASGRGLEAAETCALRWCSSGKQVIIHTKNEIGADYGDEG